MRTNPANKYLQAAQNRGRYRNADGFFDKDVMQGARGFYADASAPAAASPGNKPTSQPFILVVTSTSATAVANFDILGAYEYLQNPPTGFAWSNGNLVSGSITISSGIGTTTYSQMLAQFATSPFTVGSTFISSETAGQINQPLTVTTKNANGRTASNPMIPVVDPYQFSTTGMLFSQKYRMDGNTKVTIASVAANATITFNLYPIDDYSAVRALSDGQIVKGYQSPNIVKAQQVFIGAPQS